MTDTIQPLLERIEQEGLKKSEAAREKILDQARTQADEILKSAEKQAESIKAAAEKEAEATVARGQAALEQAARDALLQLRSELARLVNLAAEKAAAATLGEKELLQKILPELLKSGAGKVTLTASAESQALLESLLKEAGKEGSVIMNPKTGAGFQLCFSDSPESVDFSSQAVADWISHLLRPEIAALLRPSTDAE